MIQYKNMSVIDLTTNVSQIFTELYEDYSILTNLEKNVFENSLYLEGNQATSIKERLNAALLKYHRKEGTLDLYVDPLKSMEKQIFIAGNGSTQLYKGLVYAMATTFPEKEFLFVQKIPYFSGHEDAVNKVFDYPNAKYQGYNNPNEVVHKPGQTIVEFVTSPNNPDGEFRYPETNPDIILGDFVFTSTSFGIDGTGYIQKNLEWLKEVREKGTLVLSYNSASKQFGRTGDRMGYMWFPMYNDFASSILPKLNNFLAITVGSNLHGPSHFLDLLPALTKKGVKLRKDANESLKKRMEILTNAFLKRYPGSNITSLKGSPTLFVKINDPRIGAQTASEVIFEDTNVLTVDGSVYGADDSFVRVNIMAYSQDLSNFANRLIEEEKYSKYDMLISSSCSKNKILICDKKYAVNPGDRYIDVDASNNNICICLPQFLGYEPKLKLKIRRIDSSKCHVKIYSKSFHVCLDRCGFVSLVWEQPFYQNGSWEIVEMRKSKKSKVFIQIEEEKKLLLKDFNINKVFLV
jgi:histidinol-phosphate/aromatic aminotransferase/cobyric acid decarboxylase-like protein